MPRSCAAIVAAVLLSSCAFAKPKPTDAFQHALAERDHYRAELAAMRSGRVVRPLAKVDFFLFGMGPRRKCLFRGGTLFDARTNAVIRRFETVQTVILPSQYAVWMRTPSGLAAVIEDEAGVRIVQDAQETWVSRSPLKLPRFTEHQYPRVMRVLHQEILINVVDGKPLPNFFVYDKPWYRDSAMMMMALERTGNVGLLVPWVNALNSPFDRNNKGEEEADNPGQAMFMISRAAGRNHPLVPQLIEALVRFEVEGGAHIEGRSDYALHPVYQTQWAKFGLQSLGLPDPYQVPPVKDSYAPLFWWGHERHSDSSRGFGVNDTLDYPYLAWAQDHHRGTALAPVGDRDYPLSWEAHASEAHYQGLSALLPEHAGQKLAAPHTWHASEMFLLLSQ